MKTRNLFVVSFSAFTLLSCSVFGQVGSPGWSYGRSHCGPVATPPGKSLAACLSCCNSPIAPINPSNVVQCTGYCTSVFGPRLTNSTWVRWLS